VIVPVEQAVDSRLTEILSRMPQVELDAPLGCTVSVNQDGTVTSHDDLRRRLPELEAGCATTNETILVTGGSGYIGATL